jgi:hypothetical protein
MKQEISLQARKKDLKYTNSIWQISVNRSLREISLVSQQTQKSVTDREQAAKQQNVAAASSQQMDIEREMARVTQALRDLDAKIQQATDQAAIRPPDVPIQDLRSQRAALQAQLEQLGLQHQQMAANALNANAQTANQGVAQRDDVRWAQEEIQKRLTDLKADLANWQRRKSEKQNLAQ